MMLEKFTSTQLKKNVVKYLDKAGELWKIEEAAKDYKTELEDTLIQMNCTPPLKLTVALDYVLLAETAGEFASLLVNEPFFAKEVLSDVVKTCCVVLAELEEIYVYVIPKLISFPDLSNSSDENDFKNTGLFTKFGILYELYEAEKYTQAVLYKCDSRLCESLATEGSKCGQCGGGLKELPRSRVLAEMARGLLLHPSFLAPSHSAKRTQADLVEFHDDLCIGLNIGMRYNIAVTYNGDHYLAWGVIPVLPEPYIRSLTDVPMPPLPETISGLLNIVKAETHGSPWAFVNSMSAHLASNLYPLSAFLHLKTALLLSLASICSKCPVPVLALGDCEVLMSEVCECSPRSVMAPNSPLSLLLATHGVCFLQENINLSYITTAIESELVTLKADKSCKDSKFSTFPLRSAVWVSWQCNKNSSQDVHKLKTLIEIFGIPFLEEIEVNDDDISNFILSKAIDPSAGYTPQITKDDFKTFVDTVSCLQVSMSPTASALIRNYFVASRRERPHCLPLKAIKVLTGLSESHARLSLRDTVTFEDAVAAIFLYEESISVVFGPSVFSKQPKRKIDSNDTVTIARQMDNVLGRFSLWLTSYTKSQNSEDTHCLDSEEGD